MFEKKKLIKLISANSFAERVLKTFFAVSLVLFQAVFLFYIAYSLLPVVEAQYRTDTGDFLTSSELEPVNSELRANSDEPIASVDNEIIETAVEESEISEITETIETEIVNPEAAKSELGLPSVSEIKPEEDGSTNDSQPTDNELEALNPVCVELGISDKRRCLEYLELNPECRKVGIITQYQCDIFLSQDFRCKNLGLFEADCERFLKSPAVCRENNIIDANECLTVVYLAALPEECRLAGIDTHAACQNYLLAGDLPPECVSAGISNEIECRNLINGLKKIESSCLAAGINEAESCLLYRQKQVQKEACFKLGIEDEGQCDYYFSIKNIESGCASTDDQVTCDQKLFSRYGLGFCAEAGINAEAECRAYVLNKIREKIDCGDLSKWECEHILSDNFIGRIARMQFNFKDLMAGLDSGEVIAGSVDELQTKLGEAQKSIPIADAKARVGVIRSESRIVLIDSENINLTSPAMLVLDSDGDGLADDFEKRLGTDPYSADTDEDGYSDGEEARSGYNPLGDGALNKDLALIDRAILSGLEISQPLNTDKTDSSFRVTKIENVENKKEEFETAYLFSGQAEPNSIVSLYIYSDMPLLVSATTDEYGNWRYELKHALSEGEHRVFVALNDDTGKIKKRSNPLSFFIKEARAVSVDDFLPVAQSTKKSGTESMMNFYIVISVIVAIIGILLFIIFLLSRKKQEEEL